MRGVRLGRVRGVRSVPRRGEDRVIPSPAVATVHRAVEELSQRDRSLATPSLPSLRRTARKAARAPRHVRHVLSGLRRLAARARAWRGGCEIVACCPLRRDRSEAARSPRPLLSPRCVSPLAGRPTRRVSLADVARGCLAGGRECGALSPLVGRPSFLALCAAERAPSSAARRRRVRGDTGDTPPRA